MKTGEELDRGKETNDKRRGEREGELIKRGERQ